MRNVHEYAGLGQSVSPTSEAQPESLSNRSRDNLPIITQKSPVTAKDTAPRGRHRDLGDRENAASAAIPTNHLKLYCGPGKTWPGAASVASGFPHEFHPFPSVASVIALDQRI